MRILLLLSLFVLVIKTSYAQKADTIWYNSKWEKTDKANRYYYRVIERDNSKEFYFVKDFYPSGKTQMEGYYISLNPEIRNGEFKWWFENGNKQREGLFKNNSLIKMIEWDADGKVKNQSELVQTVTYKDGEPVYELKSIEVAPVFPGGIPALSNFIASSVRYPSDAEKNGVNGTVIVRFVINNKGKVIDAEVVQSIYPSLDKEALRVINLMPRWEAGKQGGKSVNVKFSLPINFQK
jgi:protein TonB